MRRSSWLEDLRGQDIVRVAAAAGIRTMPGRSLGPCPACGIETRGGHDRRRGPVSFHPDTGLWFCQICKVGGDPVAMAALAATGQAKPARDRWPDVRRWAALHGLCSCDVGGAGIMAPSPRSAPRLPAAPDPRPPADEIAEVWAHALPVSENPETAAWCASRNLDIASIETFNLLRAIRPDAALPKWARFRGTPWTKSGHRAISRAFDAAGTFASLHARSLLADVEHGNKASWPACGPGSASGLVLCNAPSLLRLDLVDGYYPKRVLIGEGVADWLSLAVHYSDGDEDAPLVVGVMAGSWSRALADRIPDACEIVIATHSDDAGNGYAMQITKTIEARLRAGRLRALRIPSEEHDGEAAGRE